MSIYCLFLAGVGTDLYGGGRRIGLNDENVMPVSALANRYEVIPLMDQCEGYMKVSCYAMVRLL